MIVNRGCSNRCAVRRCYSNYQKYNGDLHLFRFPKDINRCQEWARKCGILDNYQGNLNALYTSVYRVCSLHFEEKMFKGKLKKRLIETALPTLQLNYSHHDDNNISINTITSMPDEHSTVNELEAVILKPCQMDAMDASPTEPVMKQDCEEPTEPRIKVEHLMITPPDIKQKAKFNHTEDNVSETDIDIKDDIVGSVGNVKQELREFHLCEVCDATFGTALEVEDHKIKNFRCQHQEADIKEQPQHGMDNIIYVCSTCNKIYEGKEELINHKNEISSCHEHKICEKCGSDFTCTLELEFHMKTIHIVKDQGLKLELKEHQIEDPEYLKKFDIKEEPQDEMDNIYVCSICDEMYKSKDELIYHKEEKAGCHEHKMCDKCESNFTCTWELEDHLKTVHGLKNQDMGKKNRGIRAKWTEDMMEEALRLLRLGHSQDSVSQRSGIPRRTLRNHLKTGSKKRVLGAKTILTKQQENDLVKKIINFAQKGFPLTPRVLRRSVYKFCEMLNVPHKFNREKQLAGKEWYRSFLKRHPNISQKKAQQLNPARAQKLNHFIVDDYFETLNNLLERTGLKYKPGNIYNMDEKGCRLMLHHQQRVLAEKGSKRVHLVGSEHGENVTIVACASALGHVIPPMVLFKGQRLKPTFADGLPAGSVVHMAPKGSMTTEIFVKWLDHFSKFMSSPPTILIFDGASSHLDITIADKAESLQIELLCLPSNTTHELQPMDKSVFRSFESHWDQELLDYWDQHPDRKLNKERFSDVFTPVWGKSMTISNICSGFRATGIYPFNKNAIHAFAPSLPTQRYQHENIENHDPNIHNDDFRNELNMGNQWNSEDEMPLAQLIGKEAQNKNKNSFSEILVTPDMQPTKTIPRKKALNYRAQEIKRDVFKDDSPKKMPTSSKTKKKSADLPTTSQTASTEVWMCSVCDNDYVADMRSCIS